jgi:hypothetical protein
MPKTRLKLLVTMLTFVSVAFFVVLYLVRFQEEEPAISEVLPPSLEIVADFNVNAGSINNADPVAQLCEKLPVTGHEAGNVVGDFNPMKAGFDYYHADVDFKVSDLKNFIKPESGQKVFFAHYPANWPEENRDWIVYPTNDQEVLDYTVNAGFGFYLFACKDGQTLFSGSDQPVEVLPDLSGVEDSWVQVAVSEDINEHLNVMDVSSIWYQERDLNVLKKESEFSKLNKFDSYDFGLDHKMMWVKLREPYVPDLTLTVEANKQPELANVFEDVKPELQPDEELEVNNSLPKSLTVDSAYAAVGDFVQLNLLDIEGVNTRLPENWTLAGYVNGSYDLTVDSFDFDPKEVKYSLATAKDFELLDFVLLDENGTYVDSVFVSVTSRVKPGVAMGDLSLNCMAQQLAFTLYFNSEVSNNVDIKALNYLWVDLDNLNTTASTQNYEVAAGDYIAEGYNYLLRAFDSNGGAVGYTRCSGTVSLAKDRVERERMPSFECEVELENSVGIVPLTESVQYRLVSALDLSDYQLEWTLNDEVVGSNNPYVLNEPVEANLVMEYRVWNDENNYTGSCEELEIFPYQPAEVEEEGGVVDFGGSSGATINLPFEEEEKEIFMPNTPEFAPLDVINVQPQLNL